MHGSFKKFPQITNRFPLQNLYYLSQVELHKSMPNSSADAVMAIWRYLGKL